MWDTNIVAPSNPGAQLRKYLEWHQIQKAISPNFNTFKMKGF